MTDPHIIERLRQKKTNALVAKYVHNLRVGSLHRFSFVADLLALAVPVGYVTIRLLAKDTAWSQAVEFVWELLAASLLVITIVKLVRRTQERAETHTKLMGQNISVAAQVDYLTAQYNKGTLNDEAVNLFLLSSELDRADAEALSDVTDTEKQAAYRDALKQEKGAVCETCGASPWQYTPGTCQMCGNTPQRGGKP